MLEAKKSELKKTPQGRLYKKVKDDYLWVHEGLETLVGTWMPFGLHFASDPDNCWRAGEGEGRVAQGGGHLSGITQARGVLAVFRGGGHPSV